LIKTVKKQKIENEMFALAQILRREISSRQFFIFYRFLWLQAIAPYGQIRAPLVGEDIILQKNNEFL
jgi:hypothetical protein